MASKESQDNGDFDIEYYERTGGRELQEIKMIPYIKREVDNFKERPSRYMMILNMLIFLLATTILILLCVMFANTRASSTPGAGGLDAETPATQAGNWQLVHTAYINSPIAYRTI